MMFNHEEQEYNDANYDADEKHMLDSAIDIDAILLQIRQTTAKDEDEKHVLVNVVEIDAPLCWSYQIVGKAKELTLLLFKRVENDVVIFSYAKTIFKTKIMLFRLEIRYVS